MLAQRKYPQFVFLPGVTKFKDLCQADRTSTEHQPSNDSVLPVPTPGCLFFCLLRAFIRIIKHFISVDSVSYNFNRQQFHSYFTWILDSASFSFVPIKLRLCQQIDCHFTPAHIQT